MVLVLASGLSEIVTFSLAANVVAVMPKLSASVQDLSSLFMFNIG
jgi:hypothetical protein